MIRRPPRSTLFPTRRSSDLFRDRVQQLGYTLSQEQLESAFVRFKALADKKKEVFDEDIEALVDDQLELRDRKSTRLNSSHANISYAVFCLKKKKNIK